MRYELDENEYICKVFFGCYGEGCTEYKGRIPLGYYSLEEWAEKGNIRAYKIVDGTLTYDSNKAAEIELEMELSNNVVVLYENEDGSSDTLTLKDNYTNYDYIEAFGTRNGGYSGYGKFIIKNSNVCSVYASNFSSSSLTIYANNLTFDGASVRQTGGAIALWSSNGSVAGVSSNPEIKIQKIIGYKELKQDTIIYEEPDLSIDVLTIKVENENLILENTLSTVNNETLTINVDANVNEEVIKFG